MIKVTLTNDILKKISIIDENRFSIKIIEIPPMQEFFRLNSVSNTYFSHPLYIFNGR